MTSLLEFKVLSFDVYGTLIDHDRGIITSLEPALQASGKGLDPKDILKVYSSLEAENQAQHPSQRYSESLSAIHPELCKRLGLRAPTKEESERFGKSVGNWPAFPDTVEALSRLKKFYKLVVLSNVDNESFKKSNDVGLQGFRFDAVYTAEDIGSYKPSRKNFEFMLNHVKKEFGVERNQVLQTAQSQFHDHHPAQQMGLSSAWIFRSDSIFGSRDDPVFDWKFDSLAELADAVEQEMQ